jgi:hypothetical protein
VRGSFSLICDEYDLTVFFTRLIKDPGDFSIGLTYRDGAGNKYNLRRYNGDHGEVHYNSYEDTYIDGQHIHMTTESTQIGGHKDETHIVKTDKYKTFEEAKTVFMNDMNIRIADARVKKYGDILRY